MAFELCLRLSNRMHLAGDGVIVNTDRFAEIDRHYLSLKGNDSNLLIVFYVQIMPDDLVMQLQ
ncbi:hypothetical protein, partial [Enterobacter hormaechei]|uniref:hypothetical protein n=1 Tax=Enterobacter hormaechei TaxID=158836 RepID=UPI0026582B02